MKLFAIFLTSNDERLDEICTVKVEMLNADGSVLDTQYHQNSSFKSVGELIHNRNRDGVEMSVLDYGDELRGIITPLGDLVTHSYVITKFID